MSSHVCTCPLYASAGTGRYLSCRYRTAVAVANCIEKALQAPDQWPHTMVLIDAGSSGSRAHIFFYRHPKKSAGRGALPIVQLPQASYSIMPGLSAYTDRPEKARESLRQLIMFVKTMVRSPASTTCRTLVHANDGSSDRQLASHTFSLLIPSPLQTHCSTLRLE